MRHDEAMTDISRVVAVRQVPERVNRKSQRRFLRSLQGSIKVHRPWIVFDCSKIRRMDERTTLLLLCCLEDAMKGNGDVRLAAIPKHAKPMLDFTGADRLFEIFDTNEEAVQSFSRPQLLTASTEPPYSEASVNFDNDHNQ